MRELGRRPLRRRYHQIVTDPVEWAMTAIKPGMTIEQIKGIVETAIMMVLPREGSNPEKRRTGKSKSA